MTERLELTITDDARDAAKFIRSPITSNWYVQVNDQAQVRIRKEQQKELVDFLTQGSAKEEPDSGLFYLIRQRRDNPLKLKVMFANTTSAKMFTSRASANEHKGRMDRQHGDKFKFFVVKEVK